MSRKRTYQLHRDRRKRHVRAVRPCCFCLALLSGLEMCCIKRCSRWDNLDRKTSRKQNLHWTRRVERAGYRGAAKTTPFGGGGGEAGKQKERLTKAWIK